MTGRSQLNDFLLEQQQQAASSRTRKVLDRVPMEKNSNSNKQKNDEVGRGGNSRRREQQQQQQQNRDSKAPQPQPQPKLKPKPQQPLTGKKKKGARRGKRNGKKPAVLKEKQDSNRKTSRHQHKQKATIDDLPNEILASIFEMVATDVDEAEGRLGNLSIRAVSKRWKAVFDSCTSFEHIPFICESVSASSKSYWGSQMSIKDFVYWWRSEIQSRR